MSSTPTWTRVNGRLWRTMDYPGVAESIASIERVAKKKEEMPKCDYCDKDGIYPQCRGRFVTCEEHILLPSKEEEGKDYHAHDRRLYASECEDEDEEDEPEECNQCNVELDKTTGRGWIEELGCLCMRCYDLRKDDFPDGV